MLICKCKSCGADIVWVTMQSGKSMPCDSQAVTYKQDKNGKERFITPNGETINGFTTADANNATGIGYVPHWATCPNYKQHKKQGA